MSVRPKYVANRRASETPMDLVDSVLEGLNLESTVFCRMDLSGTWGFAKEALQGAPFQVVLFGEAWLRLSGEESLTRLRAGDVVILPGGEAHDMMAIQKARLVPFAQVLANVGIPSWSPGARVQIGTLRFGQGETPTTQLISGVFGFRGQRENPLLKALPRVLHLRAEEAAEKSASAWLSATVALLGAEVASGRPGAGAVASRLADILFMQAIRMHIANEASEDRGWLRGIADPQIGPALSLIHAHPEAPWQVATLAEAVGMSRSRFAKRFQEVVGKPPLDYVTQWRMYKAAGRLSEGRVRVADLAEQAGYASEVAFSKAFKRWAGLSPAEYKRRMHAPPR